MDDKLRLGFEGGAGVSPGALQGESPREAIQLSAGYEPGTTYLRLDATSLVLPTNANKYSNKAPGGGWRVGAGVAFDHGRVGFAAIAGGGMLQGLSDAARSNQSLCSERQPVFTAVAGLRLVGNRLGLFLHPRLEMQTCIGSH